MISNVCIFLLIFASTAFTVASAEPRGYVSYNNSLRNARGKKGGKNKNDKKCPKVSPVSSGNEKCGITGQKCSFEYTSTIPGGICENNDECTCKDGTWDCKETIGCVSDNPPFILGCPETSPVKTQEESCDDEHQEDPCSYVYPSTAPGGRCESTDTCSCTKGKWKCKTIQMCVSDNPPMFISCPEKSPFVSNDFICDDKHQNDPCTFEYSTHDGLCTYMDSCSCVSGSWDCVSEVICD
jgi:hypothetical protein